MFSVREEEKKWAFSSVEFDVMHPTTYIFKTYFPGNSWATVTVHATPDYGA